MSGRGAIPAAPRSEHDRASALQGLCLHCGVASSTGETFCCYGCELAHELTSRGDDARQRTAATLTVALLLSMLVMMLSLFLYAEDVYDASPEPLFAWFQHAASWAAAGLTSVVVLLLGPPLARRALRALVDRRLTMELLILGAAGAAWVVSLVSVFSGSTDVYFDSAAAALVLVTFGRYIEARARARAGGVVGPLLEPSTRPVLAADGPDERLTSMAPALITPGMRVEIAPDGVVPVDMRAKSSAEVSLAAVTGESSPVLVEPGDEVPAGAVVLSAPLAGDALRAASDSTLAELERLTRSLREQRGRVLRLADRFAAWLTPVIAAVAVGAFWFWSRSHGPAAGIEVALAVVLVACPCTYGVITPLISWLSLRQAFANDVCIRDASVIDALASVRTVVFDKTGTLTEPGTEIEVRIGAELSRDRVTALAAALERDVPHPVARAIASLKPMSQGEGVHRAVIEPRGVRAATADGTLLAIGAPTWVESLGAVIPDSWRDATAVLAEGRRAVGAFVVAERLRVDARHAVVQLTELGTAAIIASGDRRERVSRVGAALDVEHAEAELSPADKSALVSSLDHPALVGDGVNDAPAGAASVVSFAVSEAASLQRGVADVVLLSPRLELVPWTLGLARRAVSLGRHTLMAATAYNLVFVTLAAAGLLRPVWAGLSMLVASFVALAGALRMTSHPAPRSSPTHGAAPAQEPATATGVAEVVA